MVTKSEKISKKTDDDLSWHEEIIKAQLGQWIDDVQKKADLEHRLKIAFENSKSHTQTLSRM